MLQTGPAPLAFLLHTLELINHYGCVWDALPPGSFEVLLYEPADGADRSVFARWDCPVHTTADVLQSGHQYDWLVSNHPISLGDPPLIKTLARRNIRFMYAAGKSGWNLSDWNKLYDLILCYGPYHAARFAEQTEAVILQMGYPRFDRYFTETVDRQALYARYSCDPARQTVVWLPTWKTLSSVGYFDAEISALTREYNVVVKLHPLMPASEPWRIEALQEHAFTCVIADESDNLPLYQLADFMLFDYGGPPLAGIYTDQRCLLLNVPDAEQDALTGADSPDITIRQSLINVDPGEQRLAAILQDPAVWAAQQPVRRALRQTYFAPYFGFSAQVAAQALQALPHIFPET